MAQTQLIMLVDDVDGTEIKEGKGETISFSLDGVEYLIDLKDANAKALRKAIEPYTQSARRIAGRRSSGNRSVARRSRTGADPAAVRAWAASNGVEVSERGRISSAVLDAYKAAGN